MHIKDLLSKFYESMGISMCIVNDLHKVQMLVPTLEQESDYSFIKESVLDLCLSQFEEQGRDENTPMIHAFSEGFVIGIAKLDSNNYLVLGPTTPVPLGKPQIMNFCHLIVEEERCEELYSMMSQAPLVSYRRYVNILSLAIHFFTGKEISIEQISSCNNSISKLEQDKKILNNVYVQKEQVLKHSSQRFEIGVLTALEEGNIENVKKKLLEPIIGDIGRMSENDLQQAKYVFVSFITLVTRAAIRGGVDAETAYRLSDAYCQQMDILRNQQNITALSYEMVIHFSQLVNEGKNRGFSLAVENCRRYISAHIYEPIRMEQIAENCGLCTKTISRKFRQETGWSITDYIQKQRMYDAGYLLKYSDYSILEISSSLQYASQSYFTKKFQNVYGVTPKQYRENLKKEL